MKLRLFKNLKKKMKRKVLLFFKLTLWGSIMILSFTVYMCYFLCLLLNLKKNCFFFTLSHFLFKFFWPRKILFFMFQNSKKNLKRQFYLLYHFAS